MRRRSFSDSGFWRQRFVQIARELDAAASPAAVFAAARPRPGRIGALPRVRARVGSRAGA